MGTLTPATVVRPRAAGGLARQAGCAVLALSCLAVSGPAPAQVKSYDVPPPQGVTYTTPLESTLNLLMRSAVVPRMLANIGRDAPLAFEEQKRLTAVPAPPFKEAARAKYMQQRMQGLGLPDAYIDSEGNVIGVRKGLLTGPGVVKGRGPVLVISAHMDTVFPEGTDVAVKERDGRYYAPGIGDDTRGLVAMLEVLGAMQAQRLQTVGDIIFVATVGEEELGNLRGVKALFRDIKGIDGFISVDGIALDRVVNQGTGSHRHEILFKGPGGHSFNAFGAPSAIHAMGRAIAKIGDLEVPADPKTTFTVGTVRGGTSVNSIAGEARMAVDLRSNSNAELLRLEDKVMAAIRAAVDDENARWKSRGISVEARLIGDRPAGETPATSPLVVAARRTTQLMTAKEPGLAGASTDANLAMSLGIPAVTVSGGGEGGGIHALDEWYKPTNAWHGPQSLLLTALAMVGLAGVTDPLLELRKP